MTLSFATEGMPMVASLAVKLSAPVVLIATIRQLPVSDTQMLPSGATVTPQGTLNAGLPVPWHAVCAPVPVVWVMGFAQTPDDDMLWIRLFSVSATQMVPFR